MINMHVPISYHTMPQALTTVGHFLKGLKLKKNTMLLFSKGCYEIIKQISMPFGETMFPVYAKNFVQIRKDTWNNDYFSFIPVYSGEWFYMENFDSKNIKFNSIEKLPIEIKLITLANEFKNKDVKVYILQTNEYENPLDCIIDDYNKFKNSLIILTEKTFNILNKNTTLSNYHKGFYRLTYDYDMTNNYPGGSINLRGFNNGFYFLVECMLFPFFDNVFSIQDYPNAIFFIT